MAKQTRSKRSIDKINPRDILLKVVYNGVVVYKTHVMGHIDHILYNKWKKNNLFSWGNQEFTLEVKLEVAK